MSPSDSPSAVYTPQPLVLGPGQALSPAQGHSQAIVVVQQAAPDKSWLQQHQGQLIAGAGAGLLTIGVLLAVAVVAVAVTAGVIASTVGLLVIKALLNDKK